MIDQITEKTTYKFERITTYSDGETYTDVKMWTADALEKDYWPDIANAFLLWLGSIYQYDIRGQVKLPLDLEERVRLMADKAGVSYDEI